MDLRLQLTANLDPATQLQLNRIEAQLEAILKKEKQIMASLDDVIADVQAETTVGDSLVTLTTSLKAQLDAVLAGQLPAAQQAKVDAIFAGIEANKQKYADAVTANTPAAP